MGDRHPLKNTSLYPHCFDPKVRRIGAVYRLLKRGTIGRARAMELLAERHTPKEMKTFRATIEIWKAGPLPGMLP